MYLYVWPIAVLIALPFRSSRSRALWAAIAGAHGLFLDVYKRQADSGGKSGGHGLKRRDGAFAGFRLFEHLADGVFHGVSEVAELH